MTLNAHTQVMMNMALSNRRSDICNLQATDVSFDMSAHTLSMHPCLTYVGGYGYHINRQVNPGGVLEFTKVERLTIEVVSIIIILVRILKLPSYPIIKIP